MSNIWTDAVDQRLKELRQTYSQEETSLRLSEEYGYNYTRNAVKNRESRIVIETPEELPNYKSTVEIKGDTQISDTLIKMSKEDSKDTAFLLKAHGYDESWEIINAKSSIWNQNSKEYGMIELYSSKITVKPKQFEYTERNIEEFLLKLSKSYQSPKQNPTNYNKDGKLLELNIADLHLGKLCWVGDSNDHYDEKVAEERFFHIINDVLTKTSMYKYNKIVFVWSNDFFHYDTIAKTTTGGTPQDTNLRWQQMFELGSEMLVKAIDLLSKVAPVETMYIASNHDKMISYFATKYLSAWFRNTDQVIVSKDSRSRKFMKFGKCLIGWTHGNQEKKRINKWLQVEAAKEWGETLYREVHAAHIHSEKKIDEDGGQIIRYVSSPTGTDNWHYDSAYVGAIKKGQSFLWDKEYGLELVINTPIAT